MRRRKYIPALKFKELLSPAVFSALFREQLLHDAAWERDRHPEFHPDWCFWEREHRRWHRLWHEDLERFTAQDWYRYEHERHQRRLFWKMHDYDVKEALRQIYSDFIGRTRELRRTVTASIE